MTCVSRTLIGVTASVFVAATDGNARPAPAAYCRAAGSDDTTRPLPRSLAETTRHLLGLTASDDEIAEMGVYRCASHHVLVCVVGANLNCGKADTRRALPAADQYCRANPDARFIPMVVTGHETAFSWSCRGASAVAGKPPRPLDDRGFVASLWKRVD